MRLLTYETVERTVENRVEAKAKIFGQEWKSGAEDKGAEDKGAPPVYKIRPSLVAELYTHRIMPLTKEVQVAYLLRRLD
jgi:chorismate mutase